MKGRLTEYLWLRTGQPPREYVTLVLCRDVYHCTPVELRRVPLVDILPHLMCLGVEGRMRARELRRRK